MSDTQENADKLEALEAIADAGATSVRTGDQAVNFDLDHVEKRARKKANEINPSRRPVVATIKLRGPRD